MRILQNFQLQYLPARKKYIYVHIKKYSVFESKLITKFNLKHNDVSDMENRGPYIKQHLLILTGSSGWQRRKFDMFSFVVGSPWRRNNQTLREILKCTKKSVRDNLIN